MSNPRRSDEKNFSKSHFGSTLKTTYHKRETYKQRIIKGKLFRMFLYFGGMVKFTLGN